MTTAEKVVHGTPATPARGTVTAGWVCLAAGLLGAASGILLVVVEPQVPQNRYSYPLSAAAFVTIQVWFCLQHLGLLAGQVGLRASGAAGSGRSASWGPGIGIAGMALLTVTEAVAIGAAQDPYPSPLTNVLDALYGIACIATGAGLVAVGIMVQRTGKWAGWRSWVPLALGVWVFIPMVPAIMMAYLPARLAITGWMLLYAALGWALAKPAHAVTGGHVAPVGVS
jgi:hypothetical protein